MHKVPPLCVITLHYLQSARSPSKQWQSLSLHWQHDNQRCPLANGNLGASLHLKKKTKQIKGNISSKVSEAIVWNRFLMSHWLTVMLQASPERKEEYDAIRGWGKRFILRDVTWERDSSDQNSLLPSYGQDVEQEVIKQRPGRPVADSDGDFAIPSQNRLYMGA